MSGPARKIPVQFGLLRMLVALCPGFGAAVIGTAVIELARRFSYLPGEISPAALYGIAAAGSLSLAVLSGWLDAMLNPALPKIDGVISIPVLLRSIAIFVALQIIVAPIMFAGSAILLSQIRP